MAEVWWTANLDGAGSNLKPIKRYLDQMKPRKSQTADDVLAVFREHQVRGAAISIKHIGPDGKELN